MIMTGAIKAPTRQGGAVRMSAGTAATGARLKKPSWKDPRLLVGVLLVLASVAGVVSLVGSADRTTEVFAAREAIAVGERLTPENISRVKVRLGDVEPHYITAESGMPDGLVAVQRIGKDQLLPRESLGSVDALDRKPVAVTVQEALPEQAVAGTRVDVWVSLPDARNGFARAPTAAARRGNRPGRTGIHGLGCVEVHGAHGLGRRRPDAVPSGRAGQRGEDLRGLESRRDRQVSIPVVTVGAVAGRPGWRTGAAPRSGHRGPALHGACRTAGGLPERAGPGSRRCRGQRGADGLAGGQARRRGRSDHRPDRQSRGGGEASRHRSDRRSLRQWNPQPLPRRIADAVSRHAGAGPAGLNPGTGPRYGMGFAETGAALRPETADVDPAPEPALVGTGKIMAVWGPAGSPGRTLVAVNIAGELAAEGKSVLLVDADSYGASVAAVLGLLDEAAGLAQACRLADQGLLDREALLRVAMPVAATAGTFRVLTGITRADRWTELRAAALTLVLERAREVADVVVVDTGFCLEADEELSFDTMAPRRNAATLRSLEMADTVFAVGSADSSACPGLSGGWPSSKAAVPRRESGGGAEQSPGLRRGPVPRTPAAGGVGAVRPGCGHQGLPSLRTPGPATRPCCPGRCCWNPLRNPRLRAAIAELVCAPVQRKSRSSVFSSTAKRRLKG